VALNTITLTLLQLINIKGDSDIVHVIMDISDSDIVHVIMDISDSDIAYFGPLTFLSLYIFTIWKCIVYYRLCRDGIYFDKILVSENKRYCIDNYFAYFVPVLS
jgi:hypothetical protein